MVKGYFNYRAVPTNARALHVFRHHVTDPWRRTLRHRSQKDRTAWARMTELADFWFPKPIILHPWPRDRFAVTHPRWEPYARKPHVDAAPPAWVDLGLEPLFDKIGIDMPNTAFLAPLYRSPICVSGGSTDKGKVVSFKY